MKQRTTMKSIIAGLTMLAGSVVASQAPSAWAAQPQIVVNAAHQWIDVSGYHFSTSGRVVAIYVYGLSGASKFYVTGTYVTPTTAPSSLSPCLLGPLCQAGGFVANLQQAQDPCVRGGYARLDVEAWTTGRYGKFAKAAARTVTVTCPPPTVIK